MRISKIEHGAVTDTELGTLESHIEAPPGRLWTVAESEDQSISLH